MGISSFTSILYLPIFIISTSLQSQQLVPLCLASLYLQLHQITISLTNLNILQATKTTTLAPKIFLSEAMLDNNSSDQSSASSSFVVCKDLPLLCKNYEGPSEGRKWLLVLLLLFSYIWLEVPFPDVGTRRRRRRAIARRVRHMEVNNQANSSRVHFLSSQAS